MPLIVHTQHIVVRCEACKSPLMGRYDDTEGTMFVEPCHACLNNAAKNAVEDWWIDEASTARVELNL